jgi:hypothetical protein
MPCISDCRFRITSFVAYLNKTFRHFQRDVPIYFMYFFLCVDVVKEDSACKTYEKDNICTTPLKLLSSNICICTLLLYDILKIRVNEQSGSEHRPWNKCHYSPLSVFNMIS